MKRILYVLSAAVLTYFLAGAPSAPAATVHHHHDTHTASRHGVCLEHGRHGGCLRWSYRRYRHPSPPVQHKPPHPRPPVQAQPF